MKQYDVKISHAALSDMEQIYSYIADRLLEPDTAMGQYNRIAEAIQSLNVLLTITYSFLPFRKKAQGRPSAHMQTAAFGFMPYSISQSLKILSSSLSMVPALANSSVSA